MTFSQGEFVVEINRITGAFIKTGPAIAGITWIYPDDRTYNENTETFIFPSSEINHSLYSINLSNGTIVSNPPIQNIYAFQFDNASNILYGLESNDVDDVKYIVSINPVNGIYSRIGNPMPSSLHYSGNFSTFNKINHTFIFLAPPNILYSINGNIISSPVLPLALEESIINFSLDNSTEILYGLLLDNDIGKFFFVKINPLAGSVTKIGSGTTLGSGGGSSVIDEDNQQYIYMYSSEDAGGYAITTMNIATGNVIYNTLIQGFTIMTIFQLKV
jgi:hypothetical protein